MSSPSREAAIRRLEEEEEISVFLGHHGTTSILVTGSSGQTTVEVGARDSSTALAYLQAISRQSEYGEEEEVSILPVLREDSQSRALLAELELEVQHFPRLSLLSGLVYSPTNYTRSDALDLTAAMMKACVLVSQCDILIISLDQLGPLLRSTMKTSLASSRWWLMEAMEAARSEDVLTELASLGQQPAMFSLQYTGERREEEVMARYLTYPGSQYTDWLAYNTVLRLHRALAQLRSDRADWSEENIVEALSQQRARRDRTDTFALLSFRMPGSEVITLPDIPWLVRAVVEVTDTGVEYEELKTISLTRREVETLYETVKADCPSPEFVVRVAGSGVVPSSQHNFSLSSLPGVLILPAAGQLSLSLSCNNSSQTTYTCAPVRDSDNTHLGDTTCFLFRQSR